MQKIIRKISKVGVTMQLSDFKDKMHQNRFLLLRPRPHWAWGKLTAIPRPPIAVFKGLLLRRGTGM